MINSSGGLILLNKPSGITSFNGLNAIKKSLSTRKVGHTGTLDKFAEGLIVSLFGKMTKLVPEFTGMDKEYEAIIFFGSETDTLDPEGSIIHKAEAPELSLIKKVLPEFIGTIEQTPPQYSAIHINGKRAHELVRSGKDFQIPSRKIQIYSFEILSYIKPELKVKISCSKGTYLRSLARDLAIRCNSRAFLKKLKRTVVGPFNLEQAVTPDLFEENGNVIKPWELFDFLKNVEKKIIDKTYLSDIKNGKTDVLGILSAEYEDNGEYALFDENHNMVALIMKKEGRVAYRFVC